MNIPKGWKLVPIEPTEEMMNNAMGACWFPHLVWPKMLAVVPTPPEQGKPEAWMVPSIFNVSRNGGPFKEEVCYMPQWRNSIKGYVQDEHGIRHRSYPLYSAPQTDKLRQAAEEALSAIEMIYDTSDNWIHETLYKPMVDLRAALEGK